MAREEIIFKLKMTTAEAEKSLEKVKKNISDTNKEVKDSINKFGIFGVTVGDVKNKFRELKGIAKNSLSVIKQQGQQAALGLRLMFGGKMKMGARALFKTIKVGIASTGIGLLVVAIGSLVTYLTQTKKGAELLEVAFKTVGAAISVITDRISSVGSAIIKVFKGDFKGAAEDAKKAVTGLGDEIRKEVKAMGDLTKASQALRDSQRELNVETARRRAEIERLKLIAEDTTKTEKVRIEAAKEAFRLENEVMTTRVANAEEALRIKREENELSESMAEDLDEQAQLEIDLFNIKAESTTKQIELNNKINAIQKEAEARRLQAIKEEEQARKEAAEARAKDFEEAEKLQEELFKAEEERVKKEKAIAEQAAKDKIALDKAVADSKAQIGAAALGTISEIFGKESEAGKAAAVAQATINTYQAATNAMANTPAPPPFPQIAAGIVLAAGFKNVKSILATPIENKFANGGMVSGYGTGRSDSVPARLSKGESVINARSTRMFKPILSAINEAGGGRGFEDGGTLDEGLGGITTGTVKAYVVSDEMTNNQQRLAKIRRKATI